MLDRRVTLGALATFGIQGIAFQKPTLAQDSQFNLQTRLEALVDLKDGIPQGVMATGLVISPFRNSVIKPLSLTAGFADFEQKLAFTEDTAFRVASISKLGVAMAIHRLTAKGKINLDDPASKALGFELRNPYFPNIPIRIRHLLSHTSTIVDHEPYWMDAPGHIKDLFVAEKFSYANGLGPGRYFTYANLNYGILGTIIENVTLQRFDLYMQSLLPFDTGYGWSGVSKSKRNVAASLYRRFSDGWKVQADSRETLMADNLVVRKEKNFNLKDYVIGSNGTVFGPQGGLRASLNDLIALVQRAMDNQSMKKIAWQYDAVIKNGNTEDNFYSTYGLGPFVMTPIVSPLKGHMMFGHHGQAYGLFAGVWHIPSLRLTLSYAVTGTPEAVPMSKNPSLTVWEYEIFDIVKQHINHALA